MTGGCTARISHKAAHHVAQPKEYRVGQPRDGSQSNTPRSVVQHLYNCCQNNIVVQHATAQVDDVSQRRPFRHQARL